MSTKTPKPSTTNYIPTIGLFHTPASIHEVQDWVGIHNSDDQPHLTTASMMTYNLMATAYNDAVQERNEVIQDLLSVIEEHSSNEQIITPRPCKSITDLRIQYTLEKEE